MREWHTVTVALRASSICATGLPTRSERPTTTASAPSSSTSWRSSSSMQPAGVHGRRPGRPLASRPAETGVSPSTSLPGSISQVSAVAVDVPRRRELEQDPRHARVGVELGEQRLDLGLRRVGGQPVVEALHADLVRRLLLAADVDGGGGVLPDQHGRQAGRRRGRRRPTSATSAATSRRTSSAIAFPSMISALMRAATYPLRSRTRARAGRARAATGRAGPRARRRVRAPAA